MKIRMLMLGKNKDSYISDGVADFSKKISPYCELELVYLKDERVHDDIHKILEKEADTILEALHSDEFVVVLDDLGKSFDTEKLADYFSKLKDQGTGKMCCIIGSSHGLSERIIKKANLVLSLSPLTMNHQIVRLVLLEQLYRVFTILRGMKYHK
jgi:23S rRNA (pseudouridine1915-N3)-methyltransferase